MVDISTLTKGAVSTSWLEDQANQVTALLSSDNSYTILTLIESLGPVLTDTHVEIRSSGLSLVTSVLSSLSPSFLHTEDTGLLVMFYTDRLRDHHSLLPHCLTGLAALARYDNLSVEHLTQMLDMMFREVMVQQQVVRDRTIVFNMLAYLLTNKLDKITQIATQYTVGILQAMDGEKDPRNLLVLFNTVATLLDSLDISHLREDVFESLAVYFPVDFNPPSGTAGSVTKEQLVMGLRSGLAHQTLAEFTIGLLLEKLDSDLESAKLDSLFTLSLLASKCGDEEREVWAREVEGVWVALKKETMGIRVPSSVEVQEASKLAIKSVSHYLGYQGALVTPMLDLAWVRWKDRVWGDCRPHMSQPSTRLMGAAGTVLAQVARGGARQGKEVLGLAIPTLYSTWVENTGMEARRAVMEVVTDLLEAGAIVGARVETEKWLDEMFAVYLLAVEGGGVEGVGAAVGIAKAGGLLGDANQRELVRGLVAGVKKGEEGMGTALAELARWNMDLVKSVALPDIQSLGGEGLSAMSRLWVVGLYPETLPGLIKLLISDKLSEVEGEQLIDRMASYTLTQEDKNQINPADVLCSLVRWEGRRKREQMAKVMTDFAELLSVVNCGDMGELLAKLDLSVDLWVVVSVLSSVRREVVLLWSLVVDKVMVSGDMETEEMWRLRASLVNKVPDLGDRLSWVEGGPGVSWITCGLARRGDGLSDPWLDRLLDNLDSDSVEGVTRLLSPCWWRWSVTGILYQQRLWARLRPRLTDRTASHCHLAALVSLLPRLHRQLLLPALPTLIPMVVRALTSPDAALPALTCLVEISKSQVDLISSHQTEIVHNCLDLTAPNHPLDCRRMALMVVSACSKLSDTTTVQLAPIVTRKLGDNIKDRKRLVRQEAVKARNLWYLVTQPS